MSDSKPSDETLKTALDLLCAMRSDVRREVFEDFIAGRSPHAPYLHVDAAEFMRIAERVNREIERRRVAWQPIASYPREAVPLGADPADACYWGPNVLLFVPTGQVAPASDYRILTGRLEADMWLGWNDD